MSFVPRIPALFAVVLLLVARLAVAQGTGLTGQYYDTATFGTLKTTRTDAEVDFNWGTAIPSGTTITNADTFSVAWSGQIEPEFSELYTFYVTADDGARLWVDDRLVTLRTFTGGSGEMRGQVQLGAGQRVNVRLEYIEQTGSASVRLEWSAAARAREVIPAARLYPARVDKAGGALLREHWSGLAGASIATLTGNANYPSKPSGREYLTTFECLAQDWADGYGTRVTGFIVPAVTGSYTFAVSGNDAVQLFLSTDATAANKTQIASTTSATNFRQWNAQPSQQSAPRVLVQGQRYYVELLQKEDTGADHWSVGWMEPGDVTFSVVPGSALLQPGITTAQPAQAALLDTMGQEHPRLFATAERFAAWKAQYLSGVTSKPKTWAQNTINSANTILSQPVSTYSPDVRGTILSISNTVESRVYALGAAWWLTGDSQYAERAWSELEAAANFPDWHPAHFLDTAEMTHAFAIGYDWLYHYWDAARRTTIRTTIINKGLNAGLSQYTSNAGWSQSTGNNWNAVCNGGMSLGALTDLAVPSSVPLTAPGGLSPSIDGLAFNSSDVLFAISQGGSQLLTVNQSTGATSLIGNTGILTPDLLLGGLDFDSNGDLYAVLSAGSASSSSLYKLNSTSGAATLIGNVGFNGVSGLASLGGPTAVPEPGTALAGVIIAGLLGLRRRRAV